MNVTALAFNRTGVTGNQATGTVQATVTASAPSMAFSVALDLDNNGTIDVSGSATNSGGVITYSTAVTLPFGSVTVKARASEFSMQTGQMVPGAWNTFALNVVPPNDNAPVLNDYSLSVAENSAMETAVGTLAATDADPNPTLTYSITSGNVGDAFKINAQTGVISVQHQNQLNYEVRTQYALTVQVSDGLHTDSAAVAIAVQNVNEDPTTPDQMLTVLEDAAHGTVMGTLTASDPDAGTTFNWGIVGGNDDGAFAIGLHDGTLTVNDRTKLNYESLALRLLQVQVSDGTLVDAAVVSVQILDANDAPDL